MIGNNTLEVNQATMVAAVQYWLENVVFRDSLPPPKVCGVRVTGSGSGTFMVELRNDHAQAG